MLNNKVRKALMLVVVAGWLAMASAIALGDEVGCRAYTLQDGSVALECYEIGEGNGK